VSVWGGLGEERINQDFILVRIRCLSFLSREEDTWEEMPVIHLWIILLWGFLWDGLSTLRD